MDICLKAISHYNIVTDKAQMMNMIDKSIEVEIPP